MERIPINKVESDFPKEAANDDSLLEQDVSQMEAANDDDYSATEAMGDPDNPDTWKAVAMGDTLEPAPIPEAPSEQVEEATPMHEAANDANAEALSENVNGNEEQAGEATLEAAPATETQPEAVGIKAEELDIYSRYQSEFNIDAADLNNIEGFDQLNSDQKEFVLANLQQTALRQVESEGIVKQREAQAQASFGKKLWLGLTKGYQLNKQKKAITESIFNGEVDQTETLTALVDMVSEGPRVTKQEDGSFSVDMASAEDFSGDLSEGEHEALDHFNEKASEFNALPYEFKTGTPEQQEVYENLEKEYKLARNTILLIKKSQGASDGEQLQYGNAIDRNIMMSQFMTANPEVETALMSIKNDSAMKQTIQEIFNPRAAMTSKGGFMAMGFATRTASTSLLGMSTLAAIPAIGAGIGLWRGRVNAQEKLTEDELLARSGESWEQEKSYLDKKYEEKTGKEVATEVRHNIMSAEHLVGKMEKMIERVEEAETDEERDKLLGKLQARISYTEEKINTEMVNFGKIHEQAGYRLDLLQALGTAKAYGEMPTDEILEERVNRFLGHVDDSVDARQKKFVNRRMFQGAAIGAGFSFAGAAVAEGADAASDAVGNGAETYTEAFSNTGNEAAPGLPDEDFVIIGNETPDAVEPAVEVNPEPMQENVPGNTLPDAVQADSDRMFDALKNEFSRDHTEGANIDQVGTSSEVVDTVGATETAPELDDHAKEMLKKEIDELHAATQPPDIGEPTVDINSEHGQMLDEQMVESAQGETIDTIAKSEQEMNLKALATEINETPDYTVQPGDNVWNIIKNKLEAHDLFQGMEEGQQTHLIDELKDKVENMSEQELKDFGINSGNAQLIKAGEELDFSQIMGGDSIENAVFNAENLTDAQIESIENYTPTQPDAPITADGVGGEAGVGAEAATAEGIGAEAAADGTPEFETVQATGEQADMLRAQEEGLHGSGYNEALAEQTAVFEGVKKDLNGVLGHQGFFKFTPGEESVHWTSAHLGLRDTPVSELTERAEQFANNELSSTDLAEEAEKLEGINNQEAVQKMNNYVEQLKSDSELEPETKETISDFIYRAKGKMLGAE